jgi:hypothetical protein
VLDTTFSADGVQVVSTGVAGALDAAYEPRIEPDGDIVAPGTCDPGLGTGRDVCLLRLLADGTPDPLLDGDGIRMIPGSPGAGVDSMWRSSILPDGRVLVGGHCGATGPTNLDLCAAVFAAGGSASQYDDVGGTDWATAGAGVSNFGVCASSISGATALWSINASCPTIDGAFWNEVSASPSSIARSNPFTTNAEATLQFGTRVADTQPPGPYMAPITFTVVGV